VRAFEACTLPRQELTHAAHLTIALWYLIHLPAKEATVAIRMGLKRYLEANGVQTTPTSGYHETLTLFWICAVSFYLAAAGKDRSVLALANGLLRLLGNKDLPLRYYTRERLMSPLARVSWVEPDVRPFF
jgi:hypothetical protein